MKVNGPIPALVYRRNRDHEIAAALVEGKFARFVNSQWFQANELEWFRASLGGGKIPFDGVYVLAGDPMAGEIIAAYKEAGVKVSTLGAKAKPKAKPAKADPAPEAPKWTAKMRPETYLDKYPKGKKAALARQVIESRDS